MVRSRRRANNSAATFSSTLSISTRGSASPHGFPWRVRGPSRSGLCLTSRACRLTRSGAMRKKSCDVSIARTLVRLYVEPGIHRAQGGMQMRLMILVKADENSEAGVLPDQKILTDMGKYNEALAAAGVLLA